MKKRRLNYQADKIIDHFTRKPVAGWIRRKQLSQLDSEVSLVVARKLGHQD